MNIQQSTPAASKLSTLCTIAPLTTTLPSSNALETLTMFWTPTTTALFGQAFKYSPPCLANGVHDYQRVGR